MLCRELADATAPAECQCTDEEDAFCDGDEVFLWFCKGYVVREHYQRILCLEWWHDDGGSVWLAEDDAKSVVRTLARRRPTVQNWWHSHRTISIAWNMNRSNWELGTLEQLSQQNCSLGQADDTLRWLCSLRQPQFCLNCKPQVIWVGCRANVLGNSSCAIHNVGKCRFCSKSQ